MAGVSNTNRLNKHTPDGTTTIFAFTFFAYTIGDIKVYSVLNDVETEITAGITKNLNSSFIGGNVTFDTAPAAALGEILIRREVAYTQNTEFQDITRYKESAIEEALNTLALQIQQVQEEVSRAPKYSTGAAITNTTMQAPVDDNILIFNGTTGQIEAGGSAANINALAAISDDLITLANISSDIQLLADIEDGTDATDAIQTVAGISANINTVAADSDDIGTVATNIANINTVATDLSGDNDIGAVIDNLATIESANTNAATILEAVAASATHPYTFNTSTSMAEPGVGILRFNNGALSSVTAIAIDASTNATDNPDISDYIATWGASGGTIKGVVQFEKGDDPNTFAIYHITGTVTDNTGWLQLAVTHVASNGSFSADDTIYVKYARFGADGSTSLTGLGSFGSGAGTPAIVAVGQTDPGGNINHLDTSTLGSGSPRTFSLSNLTNSNGDATVFDLDIVVTSTNIINVDYGVPSGSSGNTTNSLENGSLQRDGLATAASGSTMTVTFSGLTSGNDYTVGFVGYRDDASRNVNLTGNGVTNYDYDPNQNPPEIYEFTGFTADGSGEVSFDIDINNGVGFVMVSGVSIAEENVSTTPTLTNTKVILLDETDSDSAKELPSETFNSILNIDTGQLADDAVTTAKITDSNITTPKIADSAVTEAKIANAAITAIREIPQNSKSADYTLVAGDAGGHIYHPSADTTARTFTIPANASVAYEIGTAITFVNDTSAGDLTISITSDTLVLAGDGTTGSRTLTANGVATALKVSATRWIISGTNLT